MSRSRLIFVFTISLLQFRFISGQVTSEVVCALNETAEFRCTAPNSTSHIFTDWHLNNATLRDGVDGDMIDRAAGSVLHLYCSAERNSSLVQCVRFAGIMNSTDLYGNPINLHIQGK